MSSISKGFHARRGNGVYPASFRARNLMPKSTKMSSEESGAARGLELSKKALYYSTPHWQEQPPLRMGGAIMMHIMLLDSVMSRRTNRLLESHGLTFNQFIALGCIGHEPDGLTHSQLSQRLMVSKTPVTSIVDRLERMGLARRVADTTDRRVSYICITDEGRERWQGVHDMFTSQKPPEFPMTEDEQLDLLNHLAHLLDSVANDDPFVTALREAPVPPENAGDLFQPEKEP